MTVRILMSYSKSFIHTSLAADFCLEPKTNALGSLDRMSFFLALRVANQNERFALCFA